MSSEKKNLETINRRVGWLKKLIEVGVANSWDKAEKNALEWLLLERARLKIISGEDEVDGNTNEEEE